MATERKLALSIDWLAVTLPYSRDYFRILPGELGKPEHAEPRGGRNGYRASLHYSNGAALLYDGGEGMGMHYVLPSRAIRDVLMCGWTTRELCLRLLDYGGKPSRIDYALDVFGVPEVSPALMWVGWLIGELSVPVQSAHQHDGRARDAKLRNSGVTFGGRQSERYMRVYDKALEQNIDVPGGWTRFELEVKGKRAAPALRDFLRRDVPLRALIANKITEFIQWPGSALDKAWELITEPGVEPVDIPRKDTDTARWLKEQVAPAIARMLIDQPNRNIMAELEQWIHDALDKKTNTSYS